MRIGMICVALPPLGGGIGWYVYNLSNRLVERGYKVTIITRGSWRKTSYTELNGIGIYRVQFLPSYPFHLQVHGFFIKRLLESLEPELDVVHLHNPWIPAIRTSLPTVATEHGSAKGLIDVLELVDLNSIVTKIFGRMFIHIDRKVLNSADEITTVSARCKDELQSWYGIKKDIKVVGNGVSTSFFTPHANEIKEPYVLYAGNLHSKKGVPDLIRSAVYIRQEYPDMKFIITGSGLTEMYLRRLVHRLNLDKNVSFVGHLDQTKLLGYYQNATVCVLPSYHEGLPTTLLEAMACGIPTVATDIGGNSEVVVDGETGFLTPPHAPPKLAEAILRLLGDEQLRKTMAINARKRAEERYDWDIITSKIEECYISAIARNT